MIHQVTYAQLDEQTGEIYSYHTKSAKSSIWKENAGGMIKQRNYTVKLYKDAKISELVGDKTDTFKTYLLMENIYKDTNIIYIQKSSTIFMPATIEDIAILLDLSLRKTKEYMKRMIAIGLIAGIKVRIGNESYHAFAFNPVYVNSSKYINRELYYLFKPYLDKYFPQWVKDKYKEWKEEGLE